MTKIFLHIGLYKTASTTIQAFLFTNRQTLYQHGYLYPESPGSSRFGAHHTLSQLQKKPDLSLKKWHALHQEIAKTEVKNVIISSENFEPLNLSSLKKVQAQLKHYEVKIIVYLRRQDLRLESQYNQNIKTGSYFGDILSFCQSKQKRSDYYQLLQPWRDIFGIENITVQPLEKSQVSNVCQNFLTHLGIKKGGNFQLVDNKNIRISSKTLAIMNLINEVCVNQPEKREFYFQKIKKFARKNWQNLPKYRFLSYKDAQAIMERYQASNYLVAKDYLQRADGVLFYEKLEPYSQDTYWNNNNFTQTELLKILQDFIK